MVRERHSVSFSELLRTSRDQQFNFRWPLAIDHRLDEMLALANSVGANTSRRELLAALILAWEPTAEELDFAVRRYRTADVKAALLAPAGASGADSITFASPPPGRRPSL